MNTQENIHPPKEKKSESIIKGTVLEIERMSTEDGPGIRTTLFLKGCSLNCEWCHNPESISRMPQIEHIQSTCISCSICIDTCTHNALSWSSNKDMILVDRNNCIGCGECAVECPTNSMKLMGEQWDVESVVKELLKDKSYFEQSNGGVTLGGGEATLQSTFTREVLKRLKQENIHTALDTCGQTSQEALKKVIEFTDIVLYDLKESHPQKHKKFTGVSNEKILDNLIFISKYMQEFSTPKELWIRTPLVPNATDTDENIKGIANFINKHLLHVVTKWELLTFNNLCKDKYLRLGINWKYMNSELLEKSHVEKLFQVAKTTLEKPDIVTWSGTTKLEEEINILDEVERQRLEIIKRANVCSI